jgi:hypothetical protein
MPAEASAVFMRPDVRHRAVRQNWRAACSISCRLNRFDFARRLRRPDAQLQPMARLFMNAVIVRRRVMQYRDAEFQYELENEEELGTELARQQASGKQYRTKRSSKPSRRRTPKASHPGQGIGARRNRRWTW